MRQVSLWFLVLTLTLPLAAQDLELPEGTVRLDTVGKLHVIGPKGCLTLTQKADLRDGLKVISERFTKLYGLDREIMRVGQVELFKEEPVDEAMLLLFPDLDGFQTWMGKPGVGGVTLHVARRKNIVGVPLKDGGLEAHTWHVLWHEFSHVFFAHYLAMGRPIWLNEGLAEYFGFNNPHFKDESSPNLAPALEELKKRQDAGESTPIATLLLMKQNEFGRQQYDEAWILVHMLMSVATDQLNDLMSVLVSLEAGAWGNLDGIENDLCNLAKDRLTRAFGGMPELQQAWNDHLAAMIRNPKAPARIKVTLRKLNQDPFTPSIDARLVGTAKAVEVEGELYKARRPKGTIVYRAPWPATMSATIAVSRDGKKWSEEWTIVEEMKAREGSKVEFKDFYMPAYEGGKIARVSVYWSLEGGGLYRTDKTWTFK